MFNKEIIINNPTRTEYVTREVHEHRAPTDKSIELLRDMEKQALDNFISRYDVTSNCINGSVFLFRNPIYNKIEWHVKFEINGEIINIEGKLQDMQFCLDNENIRNNKILTLFYEEVSKELAMKLTIDNSVEIVEQSR